MMRTIAARAVLGVMAVLLLGSAATAQVGSPVTDVVVQAWSRTGPLPTFVADEAHIHVAADVVAEQARAFVGLDPTTLEGSVTGLVLTLHEASGSMLPDDAVVFACALTSPIPADGELTAEQAPAADCTSPSPAVRGEDGSWAVPLDQLVAGWQAAGHAGLALVADPAAVTAPFRLAFDPTRTTVTTPASPGTADGAAVPDGRNGDQAEAPAAAQGSSLPAPAAAAPVTGTTPRTSTPPIQPPAPAAAPAVPTARAIEAQAAPVVADATPVTAVGQGSQVAPPAQPVADPTTAGSPPAAVVLPLVGLVALVAAVLLGPSSLSRIRPAADAARPASWWRSRPAARLAVAVGACAFVVLPALLGDATAFNLGLVAIFLVGALGLHLLVNWAGELSLAHATMIGFPAFAVAKLSADHGISPLLLLPVGILVGTAAGAVVGLPALRARGLQVALVTLAGGVAIDRFFFTRSWFVGPPAGAQVASPSLGPLQLSTTSALWPVLAVLVLAALGAAWVLYRSKLVRGLLWLKADPAAAAAFGIPVARYRALAYAIAGAFAGFAGGLTALWVQRLTAQAFPLSRSFVFLLVVVLAGRGFAGGLTSATVVLEGGRLFLGALDIALAYLGPVGLILTLTRNPDGLTGLGRRLAARYRPAPAAAHTATTDTVTDTTDTDTVTDTTDTDREPTVPTTSSAPRPVLLLGVVAIALGFTAIGLAWYHAGNATSVWVQNQELISGGIGGLAAVVLGVGLLLLDRMVVGRAQDGERWERLIAVVQDRVHDGPGQPTASVDALADLERQLVESR